MSAPGADLAAWTAFAEHWVANADRIAALTVGATDALVSRLAPAPGQRLLDVAAGVGDPTLRLARLVGPTGHVTATDGVPGMCAALRQRAQEQGLAQVVVRCVAAEALDVPSAAYDGACCRFGAMFFADASEALRRMRRAVRAEGRLVLAVWGAKDANPYFTVAMDALAALGVPPAEQQPGGKTVFECSQPGALLGVATEAGWREPREERVDLSLTLPQTSPETLLDALVSLSTRVAESLAPVEPATRAAVAEAVAARGRTWVHGADIVLPARILLVTGRS